MFAATGSPNAEPRPSFAAILDVCEATSLDDAANRGERLGWPVAPEDREWRTHFERYNGGSVRAVGWSPGAGKDERLSFWVASGPNAHVACAFSTARPGLLEALRARFGAPDDFEERGDVVSAFWRRSGREVTFARVGTSTTLNLSNRP